MPCRFLIAFQFLTVFRFSENLNENEADLAASVGYYPLVGLVLGGLLAVIFALFGHIFSPGVMGILLVLALALFTHGLHLDGLADTADGLFSHRDQARKLAIMKDSSVGVFGAAALVLFLGLKTMLLAELNGPAAWRVLVLFPLWGRWAGSLTACLSQYAREEGGLGRPFINLAGLRELYLAGGAALLFSFVFLGVPGLITALAVGLAAVAGIHVWQRRLGGVTGDVLGAVIELGECLGLLLAVALV